MIDESGQSSGFGVVALETPMVTDKMIEAAKAAYWHEVHNGGGYSDECYRAALETALTAQVQDVARDAIAEITRLRTLFSEAEQKLKDAKKIAVNAENYGYGHGLEAAAKVAGTGTFHGVFETPEDRRRAEDIARRIRALQSEER